MEPIELETLDSFVRKTVKVAILDQENGDQAPFVEKMIEKTGLCPDGTHLRIYFDDRYFFAVPLTAKVVLNDGEWSALDEQSGLNYVIRRECGLNG
ncbi:hypothetical protein V7149_06915 [Bacillus sp. JJ1503]|uniref:hypothetical protein n=1 Tax=Bacillus sp. JJ1503 TaxID=3122956 RepID=UPI002FFED39A